MIRAPSTAQKPGLWTRFLALKALWVSICLAGLVATNVATVMSADVHDWMHNAVWRLLSVAGQAVADRAMAHSPKVHLDQAVKAKTVELDAKNKQLAARTEIQAKELDAVHLKNRQMAQQMEGTGKQAKATVAAVHQRLANGISRNLAALPSEPVPYLGVVVAVAVTSLDIYDACQTMRDFNALLRMMGQGEERPQLCGTRVPSVEQVLTSARAEWRESYGRIRDEAAQVLKISIPAARTPTLDDVSKTTCPIVKLPGLCGKV